VGDAFAFGVKAEQVDALEQLLTIAAHGDVIAAGNADRLERCTAVSAGYICSALLSGKGDQYSASEPVRQYALPLIVRLSNLSVPRLPLISNVNDGGKSVRPGLVKMMRMWFAVGLKYHWVLPDGSPRSATSGQVITRPPIPSGPPPL
ncbi:hypothetical protein, partial [Xanthomonas axonopodis]